MIDAQQLQTLEPQTRKALMQRMSKLAARDEQLHAKDLLIVQREQSAVFKQALIDKLTHDVAVLKRLKFAAASYAKSRSSASRTARKNRRLLQPILQALHLERLYWSASTTLAARRQLSWPVGGGDDFFVNPVSDPSSGCC